MSLSSGGERENTLIEEACALQDPIKVPAFVTELLSVPGLDLVALYSRLESLYLIRIRNVPAETAVLYEILRVLGEKPSPTNGQTISRAAEQRAGDIRGSMTGIRF